MKTRLNKNTQPGEHEYFIIDNNETIIGKATESFNKKYWVLQMYDNPVSMRFDRLSELTKFVVSL